MHVLFSRLEVLFWHLKKQFITIKTDVKIPALLPSILVQSTTSARPTQIYMDVGVSLLRFKYPARLLKILKYKCDGINYIFPN